ncbi:Queuosine salvage protein [Aphelenchoides bicaudatus]|nr:Queuosine salvage protein [Aphelenchoides bicaudatus]
MSSFSSESHIPNGVIENGQSGWLWPREAGEFVQQNTNLVTFNADKVKEAAKLIYEEAKKNSLNKIEFHSHELHPKFDNPEETARWVFFADTINFAFWCDDGASVDYNGKNYTGYYSAAACMKRALDNGWNWAFDPYRMQTFDKNDINRIFMGKLPLPELRQKALNEAGRIIVEKYGGQVLNLLKAANGSAQKLLRLLVQDFTSYRDSTTFKGKKLLFLKRAQIFAADVYSALKDNPQTPYVNFTDINSITMFADYRVPQVLYHFGILNYADSLTKHLKSLKLIKKNSEMETAIRGLSIFACETAPSLQKITEEVGNLCKTNGQLDRTVNSADVDVFLWLYRREHSAEIEKAIPHHMVVTWFY